jgi:hypothetical protein
MRTIAVAIVLFAVLAGAADARTRITVHPRPRPPIVEHPNIGYVIEAALRMFFCTTLAYSLPPDIRPGDPRLGTCPPRAQPRQMAWR